MLVLFPHRDTIINLARYDFFEPIDRKLSSGEIVYCIAFRQQATIDEGFDLVETTSSLFISFPDEKARGDAWAALCAGLNMLVEPTSARLRKRTGAPEREPEEMDTDALARLAAGKDEEPDAPVLWERERLAPKR